MPARPASISSLAALDAGTVHQSGIASSGRRLDGSATGACADRGCCPYNLTRSAPHPVIQWWLVSAVVTRAAPTGRMV